MGPLAYGSALVTRMRRCEVMPNYATGVLRTGRGTADPASGCFFILFEAVLVDGLLVRVLAGDEPIIEELLNGSVHGAHAHRCAALDRILQLIHLALANQIRNRRR